ncbi:MAG: hypothetical protein HY667_02355 [Chloroflexi bacterium]|nr:hypothetical protein [Chloroflexota bacterium]
MKLSKMSLPLLGIGAFAIVLVSLGAMRSQQMRESSEVNAKLSSNGVQMNALRLEQLTTQKEALENRLEQATDELKKAKAVFSQATDSLSVTTTLFSVAKANGVEVTEAVSTGLAKETYEGIAFSVLPLNVKVEGELVPLIGFIDQINSKVPTGVIKAISINIPETGKGKPSVNLQLALYTYQGG